MAIMLSVSDIDEKYEFKTAYMGSLHKNATR